MISINIPNVLTIAIISIAAYAALKAGSRAIGFDTSWM